MYLSPSLIKKVLKHKYYFKLTEEGCANETKFA